MTLAQIPSGKTVEVQSVHFDEEFCKRCFALGLRCGAKVTVIRRSWFGGPIHIRIGTTDLAIRKNLANLVKVL